MRAMILSMVICGVMAIRFVAICGGAVSIRTGAIISVRSARAVICCGVIRAGTCTVICCGSVMTIYRCCIIFCLTIRRITRAIIFCMIIVICGIPSSIRALEPPLLQ